MSHMAAQSSWTLFVMASTPSAAYGAVPIAPPMSCDKEQPITAARYLYFSVNITPKKLINLVQDKPRAIFLLFNSD